MWAEKPITLSGIQIKKNVVIIFQTGRRIPTSIWVEYNPDEFCKTTCLHFVFILGLCGAYLLIMENELMCWRKFQSNNIIQILHNYCCLHLVIFTMRIRRFETKREDLNIFILCRKIIVNFGLKNILVLKRLAQLKMSELLHTVN